LLHPPGLLTQDPIFFCWGGYSLILININKTFVADYFGFLIDIEYSACPFKKHSIFLLAGVVGRQRALHTENSGFAAATLRVRWL
jgi:hypothetical protein